MTNSSRSSGVVCFCFILVCATLAFAQDWPQWRGPNRDDKVSGFTAPATWPKAFTQKWKVTVGTGCDSSPALVGDKLYVFTRQGSDEITLCLDAATGKEVWKDSNPAPQVSGPSASVHPGPRSSPVVSDGKVCTLGVGGVVSCLDAATGKVVWRKDDFPGAWPRFYTGMSPIVVDGLCIAQIGGPSNGGIVAYNLATGDQKWKWTGDGPGYASPAVMTADGVKQIITLTDKLIVGVAVADGKLLWQLPFAVSGMGYNAATPIVDGSTVYITGQGRGTKAIQVSKQGDAFTTKELWANAQVGTQFNTPVLKDGFLYGLSDRGLFFCLNAKTGERTWADTVSRQNYAAMIDAGSVILALTQKSQLSVIKPDDKAFTEIATIKVADKDTYAHPIVAGKQIFVRDADSVTLWTIE